jgi:hypothetical protein
MEAFNARGDRPYRLEISIEAVVDRSQQGIDELPIRTGAAMHLDQRPAK